MDLLLCFCIFGPGAHLPGGGRRREARVRGEQGAVLWKSQERGLQHHLERLGRPPGDDDNDDDDGDDKD